MSLIPDPRFEINLSVPMVLEYESVLKRPAQNIQLSHADIDDVIDFLCKNANRREIFYLWRPLLNDPDDDFLLELAVESNCDFIVTFNTRDFVATNNFGIVAITPREFLRTIGELG